MKNCCQVLLDCHIYILILAGQTNFLNFFYTLGKISLFVFKRECAISETPHTLDSRIAIILRLACIEHRTICRESCIFSTYSGCLFSSYFR